MVRGRKPPPVLITDAAESPEKEIRRREIRYVIMMGTRALFLVAGAVIVTKKPPLWGLWLVLCVVGGIVLPWLAVVLANDRPARRKGEPSFSSHSAGPPALPAPPDPRIIDHD